MRNPVYEQALRNQGVDFEYLERVEITAIDKTRSLANQARLEQALDEDLVRQYRTRYRAGDSFPPLVVHRPGRGKFILADGNQRYHAVLPGKDWKGLRFHDAYLIKSKDEMVLNRIAWSFNNHVNGRRLSYEECMQHAISFVRKYDWSVKAASDEWGVQYKGLERMVRIARMKDKLYEQNVKRIPSDEIVDRLGTHLAPLGDDIFAESSRVVVETGASKLDVDDLVKKMKRAKTHAEKMAVITGFESSDTIQERKAETKGGTIRKKQPLPRERLRRVLTEARNILESTRVRGIFLFNQKKDKEDAENLAGDVIRGLVQLYGSSVLPEESLTFYENGHESGHENGHENGIREKEEIGANGQPA